MLEQSLKDLKTDYIDIYMVHWPDPRTEIEETMEVLSKAKQAGKIHHIGLCNSNEEQIERASQVDRVEVLQSEFNLFTISEYGQLYDSLDRREMGFMSWGTLDKGILAGSVRKGRTFDKSDCRSWAPWWKQRDNQKRWDVAQKICNEFHLDNLTEVALNFVLNHDKVSSALCGGRSIDQWTQLFQVKRDPIRKEIIERWDELWNENSVS